MGYSLTTNTEFECVVCLELVGMILATEVHYYSGSNFYSCACARCVVTNGTYFSVCAKLRLV